MATASFATVGQPNPAFEVRAWLTAATDKPPVLPIDALAVDDINLPETSADSGMAELHLSGMAYLPAGALIEARARLILLETGVGSSLNPAFSPFVDQDGNVIQPSRIIVSRLSSGAGALAVGSAPGAVVRR